jgi:hypothetical protein
MLVSGWLLSHYSGLLLTLPLMLLASFLSMSDLSAWCAGKNVEDDRLKCDGERHVGGRRFVYSFPGIRVAWLDLTGLQSR